MLHVLKRSSGFGLARQVSVKNVSGSICRLLSTKAAGFDFMSGEHKASIASGLTFSTGIIGHLSEASVMCNAGGSVVHAVVNSARPEGPTNAFLPLTVDYRSRQYAFGHIPKTNARREKHGGDDEILVSRCIDRAVRPLFPKGYVNEVQLLVTAHAADGVNDPTIAAVNAASFALMCSDQPWYGPIGCVRVGLIDGELRVDPSIKDMERSTLDFVYAGTEGRALMVEALGQQIPEEVIVQATKMADIAVTEIIHTQRKLVDEIQAKKAAAQAERQAALAALTGAETTAVRTTRAKKEFFSVPEAFAAAVDAMGYSDALGVYSMGILDKTARGRAEGQLRNRVIEAVKEHAEWGAQPAIVQAMAVDGMMHKAFRAVLLKEPGQEQGQQGSGEEVRRADGRLTNEVRKISSAVEVLPSVHGSSYFARGDTHVLSTVTLGSLENARQYIPIDGSGEEKKQTFMLHYDFPPYSTGEMGSATSTNRRMIGHGNLAEKGLRPVLPNLEDFPYTVRVYCECTGSNGSSSMASACGGTLALLDAGVPLKAPVAAVSVGLVTGEEVALKFGESGEAVQRGGVDQDGNQDRDHGRYTVLKDITGSEDYNGDMDYKIAGTDKGITAIQLDVKLPGGVPLHMLDDALTTAKEGRLHILDKMKDTLASARDRVKPQAPKAELIQYDVDRKSLLYGPRGDMKKYMEELYNVTIDLEHTEGAAYVYGQDGNAVAACGRLVQDIAVLVKEGDTVTATIMAVMDYGAFVTINRAQQALLHISELSHDNTLLRTPTADIIKVGQRFNVKITAVDKATGVIKVSRKALMDRAASVPDVIRPLAPATAAFAEPDELPTFSPNIEGIPLKITAADFPTTPPRAFSKEFFSNNVVSDADVKSAMKRQERKMNPTPTPTPSSSPASTATTTTVSAPAAPLSPPPRTYPQRNANSSAQGAQRGSNSNNNSNNRNQQGRSSQQQRAASPRQHTNSNSKSAPRGPSSTQVAPGFVVNDALLETAEPPAPLNIDSVGSLLDGPAPSASNADASAPITTATSVQPADHDVQKKVDVKQRRHNTAAKKQHNSTSYGSNSNKVEVSAQSSDVVSSTDGGSSPI